MRLHVFLLVSMFAFAISCVFPESAPPPPTLLDPVEGALLDPAEQVFSWQFDGARMPDRYTLQFFSGDRSSENPIELEAAETMATVTAAAYPENCDPCNWDVTAHFGALSVRSPTRTLLSNPGPSVSLSGLEPDNTLPLGTTQTTLQALFTQAVTNVDSTSPSPSVEISPPAVLGAVIEVSDTVYDLPISNLEDGRSYSLSFANTILNTNNVPLPRTEFPFSVGSDSSNPMVTMLSIGDFVDLAGTNSLRVEVVFSELVRGVESGVSLVSANTGSIDSIVPLDAGTVYEINLVNMEQGDYTLSFDSSITDIGPNQNPLDLFEHDFSTDPSSCSGWALQPPVITMQPVDATPADIDSFSWQTDPLVTNYIAEWSEASTNIWNPITMVTDDGTNQMTAEVDIPNTGFYQFRVTAQRNDCPLDSVPAVTDIFRICTNPWVNASTTLANVNDHAAVYSPFSGHIFLVRASGEIDAAQVQPNGVLGPWTTRATLSNGTATARVAVVWNEWLYVMGGNDTGMQNTFGFQMNADGTFIGGENDLEDVLPDYDSAAGAIIGDYIYIISGAPQNNLTASVYRSTINAADGTLSPWVTVPFDVADIPEARENWSAVTYNNFIYLPGGRNNVPTRQNNVFYGELDPVDGDLGNGNMWQTATGTLMQERDNYAAVVHDKYLIMLGGNTNVMTSGTTLVDIAEILPSGDLTAFVPDEPLPAARRHFKAVSAQGFVYVIGGNNSNTVWRTRLNVDGTVGCG